VGRLRSHKDAATFSCAYRINKRQEKRLVVVDILIDTTNKGMLIKVIFKKCIHTLIIPFCVLALVDPLPIFIPFWHGSMVTLRLCLVGSFGTYIALLAMH